MSGKRRISMPFAKRLHSVLGISSDLILEICIIGTNRITTDADLYMIDAGRSFFTYRDPASRGFRV